jgi:ribosomal-protein-serine acetyltransferase
VSTPFFTLSLNVESSQFRFEAHFDDHYLESEEGVSVFTHVLYPHHQNKFLKNFRFSKFLFLESVSYLKAMYSNFVRQMLSSKGAYMELIEPEHLNQLYELFELNRDYLRQCINGIDSIQSRDDLRRRWGVSTDSSISLGIWVNEMQIVGRCRLTRQDDSDRADAGYWLSESHQGQGLMTAAVTALIKFAFEEWQVKCIEIHCGENNLKSRAIPERLGFLNEGISSVHPLVQVNGQMVQSITYSKTRQ